MGTININNRFIFVHIPKTAGLSMSKVFNCSTGNRSLDYYRSLIHQRILTGTPKYKDFKTFAFVRNPYDRFVSSYRYSLQKGFFEGTFEEFSKGFLDMEFMDYEHTMTRPQHTYICDPQSKRILVGFVGRVENLLEDWNKALKFIGHPKAPLPLSNQSDHTIEAIYTADIRKVVEDYYKDDFDIFNYDMV